MPDIVSTASDLTIRPVDIVLNFEQHLITQLLILIDFILSGSQFHKPHVFAVCVFGFLYLVVNAAVSLKIFVVYPILTWRDGFTALWVIVCIAVAIGFFFIFYWLGKKKTIGDLTHTTLLSRGSSPRDETVEIVEAVSP